MERGRRSHLSPATTTRIALALGLDSAAHDRLVWATEHDRLIDQVMSGQLAMAVPLVSAALRAATRLSPEEALALGTYMDELIDAREKLDGIAPRTQLLQGKEGAAMT